MYASLSLNELIHLYMVMNNYMAIYMLSLFYAFCTRIPSVQYKFNSLTEKYDIVFEFNVISNIVMQTVIFVLHMM